MWVQSASLVSIYQLSTTYYFPILTLRTQSPNFTIASFSCVFLHRIAIWFTPGITFHFPTDRDFSDPFNVAVLRLSLAVCSYDVFFKGLNVKS